MSISEPPRADPIPYPQDPYPPESGRAHADADHHVRPDPLLKSGSYVSASVNPDEERATVRAPNGEIGHRESNRAGARRELNGDERAQCSHPAAGIAAEPLQSRRPNRMPEPTASSTASPERPEWLPEGWSIQRKVRSSGASAGTIDRYYVEPISGHRFRSKKEVHHFLETGLMRRRKLNPDADVTSSESPGSHKQKKSGLSAKTFAPPNIDLDNVPEEVTWVLTDASKGIWTPCIGDEKVLQSTKREWIAAFDYFNARKSGGII